ncbi:DM13 domain-containing protein [Sporichthya polymorpha]|uniref:DM13 domain-containing protein n=1 Tax=Sporichthya polymorpha TaxID=35751 RepID=UPI0003777B88|nr:DM13 domain-containing protein [Sporichthya polymorpha]
MKRLLRHRGVQAGLALFSVLVAVALAAFEPWKLWIDKTVVEAFPVAPVAVAEAPVALPTAAPTPKPGPAWVELYRGELLSHEHSTTGTVRVIRLADGSRVLRLENLDTSNGPDLKVVLSDAPVIEGRGGWHVFDDNAHRKIGNLKGNKGSQNYRIPADVDLVQLRSVSIWCDRFNVSFGAAALMSTT